MTQQNKNIIYTFLLSAVALLIFATAATFGITLFEEWYGVIVGIVMMVIAIPIHNIAKNYKFLYIITFLLNTIGCGFSTASYYLVSGEASDYSQFLAATLPPMALALICAIVFVIVNQRNKRICTLFCALDIVIIGVAIYNWIIEGEAFWSFLFFAAVVMFFYIIALRVVDNDEEFFGTKGSFVRTVSFFSFGIFILVTLIVAALLSEGDDFNGFDVDIFGNPNRKKKK